MKLDGFHVYVMRGTQNKLIIIKAGKVYYCQLCSCCMLFHFNFKLKFLQSSNPFLFSQHKQLSSAIFDELLLSGALLRDLMENNTRKDNFNNSCRGTSMTQH